MACEEPDCGNLVSTTMSDRERRLVEAARKVLRFIKQNHWRYGYAEGIWDMNSSGIMYEEVKDALQPYEKE